MREWATLRRQAGTLAGLPAIAIMRRIAAISTSDAIYDDHVSCEAALSSSGVGLARRRPPITPVLR
jgi:hypothetical protein